MDSGGWNIIYDADDYCIDDCGDYLAVYKKYKHEASFKDKSKAIEYCTTMTYLNKAKEQMLKDLL